MKHIHQKIHMFAAIVILLLKKKSLRTQIYSVLIAILFITSMGGVTMIWYTYRIEGLFSHAIEVDISAGQNLEELLQALIKQKGFVSYYFMDGDPKWLDRYAHYQQNFRELLLKAEKMAYTDRDRRVLDELETKYEKYIEAKDKVIELYKQGERKKGLVLHKNVRDNFFDLLSSCESYNNFHQEKIQATLKKNLQEAKHLRFLAALAILSALLLTLFFAVVLFKQILDPIRILIAEADRFGTERKSFNEINALRHEVRGLIEDSDQTHSELEKSRTLLAQSEKMAMVGQLAAGVAHSIRNPMTSIKMRLFSLEKNLQLSSTQSEDLEVISEEIKHIDNIVQNFLEYSKPTKIKKQKINPSDIVDMSLRLLHHRFKSQSIEIILERAYPLPEVLGDADQLKEIFVNIFVNACEAMPKGGWINIHEEADVLKPMGPVAVIRISDNGPGIPETIRHKVFEPFFSTKAEGTGLGLSIARQIIQQHQGLLTLQTEERVGTTFIVTLRCGEAKNWAL